VRHNRPSGARITDGRCAAGTGSAIMDYGANQPVTVYQLPPAMTFATLAGCA
jgi:hypothetical protein